MQRVTLVSPKSLWTSENKFALCPLASNTKYLLNDDDKWTEYNASSTEMHTLPIPESNTKIKHSPISVSRWLTGGENVYGGIALLISNTQGQNIKVSVEDMVPAILQLQYHSIKVYSNDTKVDISQFDFEFKPTVMRGKPAILSWNLELPDPTISQFDYNSISDVILHIDYEAEDAGNKTAVTDYLKANVDQIVDASSPVPWPCHNTLLHRQHPRWVGSNYSPDMHTSNITM